MFLVYAIDENDQILVWGENWNEQLGIGNYKRQLSPTKSIINFLNEFSLDDNHLKNAHDDTILALGLGKQTGKERAEMKHAEKEKMEQEKTNKEQAKMERIEKLKAEKERVTKAEKSNVIASFVNHNKKFLLSFLLNIILFWRIYKIRMDTSRT